jgi:hypothetical protein
MPAYIEWIVTGNGTPNRTDRDCDGDGVRNSQDRRPDDARRY